MLKTQEPLAKHQTCIHRADGDPIGRLCRVLDWFDYQGIRKYRIECDGKTESSINQHELIVTDDVDELQQARDFVVSIFSDPAFVNDSPKVLANQLCCELQGVQSVRLKFDSTPRKYQCILEVPGALLGPVSTGDFTDDGDRLIELLDQEMVSRRLAKT